MQKKTKREVLGIIAEAMADNADVVAYCTNEVALLDKKNEYRKTAPKKPTKAQLEAEALKPKVYEIINAEGKTSNDIAKVLDVSFQRVTPILKTLKGEGLIKAETVKGKTLYTRTEVEA